MLQIEDGVGWISLGEEGFFGFEVNDPTPDAFLCQEANGIEELFFLVDLQIATSLKRARLASRSMPRKHHFGCGSVEVGAGLTIDHGAKDLEIEPERSSLPEMGSAVPICFTMESRRWGQTARVRSQSNFVHRRLNVEHPAVHY
jgi:hypothetical protein